MPKVTVIIPNYNHANFLEKRIQSVLDQTYQDFEVIFLDDASTDHSREVFAQFADHPKMRAILNDQNTGSPFKQWNKGVREAKGDYIWIAESDDYADPKLLETLVPVLEQNPSVGLAYCQSWKVDAQDNILSTLHYWTDDLSEERWRNHYINNGRDECKHYMVIKNTIPNASAILLRRTTFEAIGYAEESVRLCGDWITWIKILLQSDVAFVADPLNYHRFHGATVRSKAWSQGLDIYEEMKVFLFLKQNLDLAQAIKSAMTDKLLTEWFSRMMMMRRFEGVTAQYFGDSYRVAQQIEPFVALRLANKLLAYTIARIQSRIKNLPPQASKSV